MPSCTCRRALSAAALIGASASLGCGQPALEWVNEDGYRWAELHVAGRDEPGFRQLAESETGISFANTVTEAQYIENSHTLNGSGVALGDMDGDGRVDIYLASMDGPNALYRNLGDWKFEEIAAQAGVAASDRFSTGAVFADVDGDGDLDLLVNALGGPNALYLNDGAGGFTDATEAAGLTSSLGSMSMALADIDGDGDLDLYVVNNKVATVQDLFPPEVLQPSNLYRWVGDRPELLPEFQQHYLPRLVARFQPSRVLLFGSRARGDALRHSDLDLIIVADAFAHVPFLERMVAVSECLDPPFAVEALCYTPEEFERKRREIGIVQTAEREGKDLWPL